MFPSLPHSTNSGRPPLPSPAPVLKEFFNELKRNPEDSHVYRKILTEMFDPSRGRTNVNVLKTINLSSRWDANTKTIFKNCHSQRKRESTSKVRGCHSERSEESTSVGSSMTDFA
ncbi:MAG: hypothetical protein V4642_01960 [Bacteroidota bacterium]